MAVARVDDQSATGKRQASFIETATALTLSGSDQAIYAFVHGKKKNNGDANESGVIFDDDGTSQNFTFVGRIVRASGVVFVALYRLIAPTAPTGSAFVKATFTVQETTWDGGGVGGISFSGVDGSTPNDAFQSNENTNTSAQVTVTTSADDLIVAAMTGNNVTATLQDLGTATEAYNDINSRCRQAGAYEDSAGSIITDWNLSASTNWVAAGANLNAAAAAAVGQTHQMIL